MQIVTKEPHADQNPKYAIFSKEKSTKQNLWLFSKMEILQFLNFLDPSTKAFLIFCGISVLVSFEECNTPYIF